MRKGAHKNSAEWYDSLIEPLVRAVRTTGLTLFPPNEGMSVLDVGCGTGTHLHLYQEAGCRVFGIDLSLAMLNVAQAKLAGRAGLCLGDAARMPFPDESVDLITAMLALHEMPAPLRSPVVREAKRVMKKDGRFLVIDYHPGPIRFPEGWFSRIIIACIEFMAGREHFGNYRGFMANKGLTPLLADNGLLVDRKGVAGGGTLGLYLLRAG